MKTGQFVFRMRIALMVAACLALTAIASAGATSFSTWNIWLQGIDRNGCFLDYNGWWPDSANKICDSRFKGALLVTARGWVWNDDKCYTTTCYKDQGFTFYHYCPIPCYNAYTICTPKWGASDCSLCALVVPK